MTSSSSGSSNNASARAPWWESFVQDLRYAARGLRAKPGFTIAVVLTLGLGIGANAAMFSVVDRLLFRPPPMLRDPATTHRVYAARTNRGKEFASGSIAFARYLDFSRTTTSFSRFAQVTARDLAIGTGSDAREMRVGIVSASFFGFFDAPPAIGRYYTTAEDSTPNGTPVAVLSYSYWHTEYGGRRDAVGSTIRVGPLVYTVIGVAPAGFAGLWPDQPPVAYIPISSYASTQGFIRAGQTWWTTYNWTWSNTIAQRKPGVTSAAAEADLTNAYLRSYEAELVSCPRCTPIALAKPHALIGSILTERGPNQSTLSKVATWISGVALIVLLIACANVANLLLARALNRRREIAVRLALGVSTRRLLSQLLTESMMLALLGGAAGLLFAQAGGSVLRAAFLPKAVSASVLADPRTLLFSGLAALAAGVLTGLAPALQIRSVNLTSDLKTGAREGTFHRSKLRMVLLLLQGALSVMLLVGAGLFVRSLDNVRSMRMGYDVDPVLLLDLNMRGVVLDSSQKVLLLEKLLATAKTIPDVENASLQTSVPFWSSWSTGLYVAGIDSVNTLGQFNLNGVSPEYFATLGTRIIRGRSIGVQDASGAPGAMVVSAGMAKRLWPSADAIGQCVKVNADTVPCTYVVGIAEDIKAQKLDADDAYYYYLSHAQFSPSSGGLFIRTRGQGVKFVESIRRRLQAEMPGASYVTITPFDEIIGGQTKSWSLGASMFLTFGVLALVLAAIGLFSVISYNVAQRTHELGVRVALGAQMGDLIRLVVSEGMKLGAIGVALGATAAFASAKWIAPLLFRESPRDPVVFSIVAGVLLTVTMVASFIPARRAARVDPNRALRSD
jgi:putative ABC transport system permease protein